MLIYYEMVMLDRRNSEYWAQIAAENGHVEGIVRHGGYLLDVPEFESCHRARFWLGRAKQIAAAEDRDTVNAFEQDVADKCSNVFELEDLRKK